MYDSATADFHHNKDKEDLEAQRDSDNEITGHNGSRMVSHEGHPPLGGRGSSRVKILGPIGPYGSW